jgi:microcystin-dependent protein
MACNGTTTFGLPDLQGRAAGNVGPNLYTVQGMKLGTESVTIQMTEYPAHSHNFNVHSGTAASQVPTATSVLSTTGHAPSPPPAPSPPAIYTAAQGAPLQPLLSTGNLPVVGYAPGGSLPHENMMPFLTMNCVIALTGIFPARS